MYRVVQVTSRRLFGARELANSLLSIRHFNQNEKVLICRIYRRNCTTKRHKNNNFYKLMIDVFARNQDMYADMKYDISLSLS